MILETLLLLNKISAVHEMVYLPFENLNVNKTARACVPRKYKANNNSNNSASAHSHDNCAIAT